MSQAADPQIRKAALVRGKTLTYRDATADDPELILNLRMDDKKGRFLSATFEKIYRTKAKLRA